MFSLILVVIAIALAAALVLATLYYARVAQEQAQIEAKAAGVISQGQQLLAAAQLYRVDHGTWPDDVAQLVQQNYLTATPRMAHADGFSLISTAYAAPASAQLSWTSIERGLPQYWLKDLVPKSVCQRINRKTRGDDAIYAEAVTGLQSQCFGLTEPFTAVVYVDVSDSTASSGLAQTIPAQDPTLRVINPADTPTVVVPSTGDKTFVSTEVWAIGASGSGTVSLYNAAPGPSLMGLSITPSGSSTVVYVPLSSQPLPAPPGWMPADPASQQVHPMAPPVNSTIWYWPAIKPYSGAFPQVYRTVDAPGQLACDTLYEPHKSDPRFGPLTYTGYHDSIYWCSGRWYGWQEPALSASSPLSQEQCPSGYTVAGNTVAQPRCLPTTSVPKPADGVCYFFRNAGSITMQVDAADPDCAGLGLATGTTVSITGKKGANSCSAADPSGAVVKVDTAGRVTLTQYYGSCGGQVTKTCSGSSTNTPGYYQAAQMGTMTCG